MTFEQFLVGFGALFAYFIVVAVALAAALLLRRRRERPSVGAPRPADPESRKFYGFFTGDGS